MAGPASAISGFILELFESRDCDTGYFQQLRGQGKARVRPARSFALVITQSASSVLPLSLCTSVMVQAPYEITAASSELARWRLFV
jgi:hypothetical protein